MCGWPWNKCTECGEQELIEFKVHRCWPAQVQNANCVRPKDLLVVERMRTLCTTHAGVTQLPLLDDPFGPNAAVSSRPQTATSEFVPTCEEPIPEAPSSADDMATGLQGDMVVSSDTSNTGQAVTNSRPWGNLDQPAVNDKSMENQLNGSRGEPQPQALVLLLLLEEGEEYTRPEKFHNDLRAAETQQSRYQEALELASGHLNPLDYEPRASFTARIAKLAVGQSKFIEEVVTNTLYDEWCGKNCNKLFVPFQWPMIAPEWYPDTQASFDRGTSFVGANGHFARPVEWTTGLHQSAPRQRQTRERYAFAVMQAGSDPDVLPYETMTEFLRRQRYAGSQKTEAELTAQYKAWLLCDSNFDFLPLNEDGQKAKDTIRHRRKRSEGAGAASRA